MAEWETLNVTTPEQRAYQQLQDLGKRCFRVNREIVKLMECDEYFDYTDRREFQLDMCSTALTWSKDSLEYGAITPARQWVDLVAFVLELWLPEEDRIIGIAKTLANDIADLEARVGGAVRTAWAAEYREGSWPTD